MDAVSENACKADVYIMPGDGMCVLGPSATDTAILTCLRVPSLAKALLLRSNLRRGCVGSNPTGGI
jgi:hypothetical protein